MRVAVGKLRIVRLRKEKLAPVLRKAGERRAAARHLFDDFIAQQPTEAGADLGKLLSSFRWDRRPAKEIADEWKQRRGRRQLHARTFNIAVEVDDRADKFAVAPQAKRVAIGVNQIRKRLELIPLLLIVQIIELARIGALAWGLDFNALVTVTA